MSDSSEQRDEKSDADEPGRVANGQEQSGIEHGEAQLQELQDDIDKVRSQTGQAREEPEERQVTEEGYEVAPPG